MFPVLLPLAAVVSVAAVMIALGIIFLEAGHTGTIIIGLAIIILVPLIGALLTRGSNDVSS